MRMLLAASVLAAVIAAGVTFQGAVWAQNRDLDGLRLQSLQQQNMQAQEQQNVLRRLQADDAQIQSDQHRLRTDQNLRATRPPPASLGPSLETDETMRRLQDEQLAASNARLRTIEPAAR